MERNLSFPEATVQGVRAKLTWAQVEVVSTKADQVQIFIAGDDESVEELRVEQTGDGVLVAQPQLAYAKEILPRRRWLQICLRLPKTWRGDLDVDTVSGTTGAHGFAGANVSFASVSGPINARGVEAQYLSLHTVSGAVSGADLVAGRASLRTVSGAVKVSGAAFRTTKVFTVSAEVALVMAGQNDAMDMQSVSGVLYVETDGPVRAALHSLSGQFLLDDDLRAMQAADHKTEITASSVSGDLAVRRRKHDAKAD